MQQIAMGHRDASTEDGTKRIPLGALATVNQTGDHLVLCVGGIPVEHLDAGDRAALHLALARLVEAGATTQADVINAGLVPRATFQRVCRAYREGGEEALRSRARRGPKGPFRATPAVQRRILRLVGRGLPTRAVAAMVQLSVDTVKGVLRRHGMGRSVPSTVQEELSAASEPAPPAGGEPQTPEANAADDGGEVPETGKQVDGPADLPTGLPPRGMTVEQVRQCEFLPARMGWVEEQSVLFEGGRGIPFAGMLLALAVLPATGLLECVRRAVGRLPNGFYGVRSLITVLFAMALLRIKRPEQLKNYSPAALGRALGLERAPEMKTVRRKVALLAEREAAMGRLLRELAQQHAERARDAMGFLYVDGHVRTYFGKRKLSKAHVTQMRLSMPATTEYWVNDARGEPVLVVAVEGNRAMTRALLEVLVEVRKVVGPSAEPTVVFDRGGWSPALFRRIRQAGFHFLTYRKGRAPSYPRSSFQPLEVRKAGERVVRPVRDGHTQLHGYGRCRCVAILRDDGKQTQILTSRETESLSAREVCERMSRRWQQENFFRYAIEHYAMDALWTYDIIAGDQDRPVPNPARKRLERQIAAAQAERKKLLAGIGGDFVDAPELLSGHELAGRNAVDVLRAGEIERQVTQWRQERHHLPTHVPLSSIREPSDIVELARAPKLLLDAVKVSAYHAETILVSHLAPHLNRSEDEARAVVAGAMQLAGDFEVREGELHVTLQPSSAPRYTRAVAGLADALNEFAPTFPETSLRLRFHVAPHPSQEAQDA
jgi:transposase